MSLFNTKIKDPIRIIEQGLVDWYPVKDDEHRWDMDKWQGGVYCGLRLTYSSWNHHKLVGYVYPDLEYRGPEKYITSGSKM